MMNVKKYQKQYYMPPVLCMDWAKKDSIEKAPVWCSVDLRDGNQVSKRSRLASRQHPRPNMSFSAP